MKQYLNPDKKEWRKILARPVIDASALSEKVKEILDEIRRDGAAALQKYARLFDGATLDNFRVSKEEIEDACANLDNELKSAIVKASANIRLFHEKQIFDYKKIETAPGVTCWQKAVPIEKVGLYIPGGTAPLFSTVLMLGIPAQIAGCKEIVLCTPPDKTGKINPAILFAASVVGTTCIFKLGGVQAIGAMAYGVGDIPKVDKIFGPGNQYVTAAKQLVSLHDVSIDMPAGPSEVAVMADETAIPEFVASDMLSQAEHGTDSQVVLLANSSKIVDQVQQAIDSQLEKISRKDIASTVLNNSTMIVLDDKEEMIEIINEYAPEHLIISMKDPSYIADRITNAGSVFLGNYTPESAGDYASGTNHTLPTNGWARSYSGVDLDSFLKKITFQEISREGLLALGPTIEVMAAGEQLDAHKNAVSLRMTYNEPS